MNSTVRAAIYVRNSNILDRILACRVSGPDDHSDHNRHNSVRYVGYMAHQTRQRQERRYCDRTGLYPTEIHRGRTTTATDEVCGSPQ
jgi:hypothetical protein